MRGGRFALVLLVLAAGIGSVFAQGYFQGYFSSFFTPFYFSPYFFSASNNFSRVVTFPQPVVSDFDNYIRFSSLSEDIKEVVISATLKDGVADALIREDGKRRRYSFAARDREGVVLILSTLTGFSKATVRNLIEFRDLGRTSISGTSIVRTAPTSQVITSGSSGVFASVTDRDFGGISSSDEDEDIRDLSGFDACEDMFSDFDDNEDLDDVDEDDVSDCQELFDDIVDEVGKSELDNIDGFDECDNAFDDFDDDEDLDDVDEDDFKDCEDFFDDIEDETIEDLK